MSKRKTVLKFSIAALLLGGSSTVAVLYFPYVALAIASGMVFVAPVAVFAVSIVVALVSAITLAVFTVSAVRSKFGVVNEKLRNENEDEEKSLVQKKAPLITPLFPQEADKLTGPAQQQLGNNLTEEVETPQPKNVVVNGNSIDQQANQTEESLPSLPPYPEQTSPLNSMNQFEPFPDLPSIVVDRDNSSRNTKNLLPNPLKQTRVKVYSVTEGSLPPYPPILPLNSINQDQSFPSLPSIIMGDNSLEGGSDVQNHHAAQEYTSHLPEQPLTLHDANDCSVQEFTSLYNAKLALKLKDELDERKRQKFNQASMTDSYVSWGTDWNCSITDNNSLPSVSITQELEERPGGVRCFSGPNDVHHILEYQRQLSLMNNRSNSYCSSMLSSIQELESLQVSLESDNPSVQSFQPKKQLLYDVNKKVFDSIDYQVNHTRFSEHGGKADHYTWVFLPTGADVDSGPEAMSYDVNNDKAPYSSIKSSVLSSFADGGNSFSR